VRANKTSYLDHLRWVRDAILGRGGDFFVVGNTLKLAVRRLGLQWQLEPRFVDDLRGCIYASAPDLGVPLTGFAGWLPYPPRTWELAQDCRRFRALLREHSLPAPELLPAEAPDGPVLVWRTDPLDPTVLGPFSSAAEHPLAAGEEYERFLPGRRVRFWYWNGTPLCGELQRMPTVVGDGATSLRDLILERATLGRPFSDEQQGELFARVSPLLRLQGHALASPLPRGARVFVDHLLDSELLHPADRETFLVEGGGQPDWLATVRRTGEVLRSVAPPELRSDLLFSVDGVFDRDGQLWLTEMNGNPVVHPLLYPAIVDTLFERGAPSDAPASDPKVSA
jgi:hypothetical protein